VAYPGEGGGEGYGRLTIGYARPTKFSLIKPFSNKICHSCQPPRLNNKKKKLKNAGIPLEITIPKVGLRFNMLRWSNLL